VGCWAGTGNYYVGFEISSPLDIKHLSRNWLMNNHLKIGRRVLGYISHLNVSLFSNWVFGIAIIDDFQWAQFH
jgi:hypothetical protein